MLKKIKSGIKGVIFGKNVTIVEPVNIYDCKIGSGCSIGPFVEIQKNSTIGANTKVQSHSFICELVKIGRNCFISHSVVFINDTFRNNGPAKKNKKFWKKTILGNNVSIGSNSTILPVTIADNIVVGAGSVVTKNLIKTGYYAGNPARFLKKIN